jgi:hypothetical protein
MQGAHDGVYRQPEALLGLFGRLVHAASRHVADDKDIHVVRRVACCALIARGPGSVDRHGDRVEGLEFLPITNIGPNASETSSVSGRVYRLAGFADTSLERPTWRSRMCPASEKRFASAVRLELVLVREGVPAGTPKLCTRRGRMRASICGNCGALGGTRTPPF